MIEEIAIRKNQEEKEQVTARNKETLRSGGSTKPPKKKATKKKKKEFLVEIDDMESCEILRHKTDKQGEVRAEVKWESGKDWQFLYDMWEDYPREVTKYKKSNLSKCRGKLWKIPTIAGVEYFVRILGMEGEAENAVFIALANNGYKFDGDDCVKYDELEKDDPDLLEAFLDSVKNSPEADADEASIA